MGSGHTGGDTLGSLACHCGNKEKLLPLNRLIPRGRGSPVLFPGENQNEMPEIPPVIEKKPAGAGIFIGNRVEVLPDRLSGAVHNTVSIKIMA